MRLPYPRWVYLQEFGRPSGLDEALGSLAAFSAQVEVCKILSLSGLMHIDRLSWEDIYSIIRIIARDSQHISMLSIFGDPLRPVARGSIDLDYALGSIAEVKDPGVGAAVVVSTVLPAYISTLDFVSKRSSVEKVREILSKVLRDEEEDLEALSKILAGRFDGESVAQVLEERAVVLFASAGSEDSMKISIATAIRGGLVSETEANTILGDLYREIDNKRIYAAQRMLRDPGRAVDVIRKYGLSGIGLC
ncbi:hypothetical protein ATG_15030 [Desulfurococcaceae archaeon AG1]|nr:hypothetical protein ATG_15030 [Desulfurococcaceae archaeon AG1]